VNSRTHKHSPHTQLHSVRAVVTEASRVYISHSPQQITLTLASKATLSRFLSSKLLDCQTDCVEYTSQVNLNSTEIRHLKASGIGVVRDPWSLPYASDRIYIIDAPEVSHSLTECFDLRVPIGSIDVRGSCHMVRGLIELIR